MKKIMLSILLASSFIQAKEKIVQETAGWVLIVIKDDFNDKVSCHMSSKYYLNNDAAELFIQNINTEDSIISGYSSKAFLGKQTTYRVDKKEAKVLNRIFITGEEYNEMIESFKSGQILKIKVVPENRFVNIGENTIPLSGFEKLYNLAKTCNYK